MQETKEKTKEKTNLGVVLVERLDRKILVVLVVGTLKYTVNFAAADQVDTLAHVPLSVSVADRGHVVTRLGERVGEVKRVLVARLERELRKVVVDVSRLESQRVGRIHAVLVIKRKIGGGLVDSPKVLLFFLGWWWWWWWWGWFLLTTTTTKKNVIKAYRVMSAHACRKTGCCQNA